MRILQVITLSELGGAQTVVANLSNKLSERHELIVAAGEGDGKMFELLNPNIITERIPSLVRRLSPFNEIKAIFQMRKLYNRYEPDIIHLHSSKAGLLGRISFPKSKIVYTVHGFDSIRLAYRKFLPLERLLQNNCGAIVGVSKYDEMNLKKEGITNNVSTVYNGIFTPPELQDNPFKDITGYSKKILCIARLSKQKNHELFIEIAKRLPQFAFIWIGNQYIPDIEYPSNVFWKGNLKNAGSYIRFADLFLLTSNYEGLPMVIIEALATGTPVVASNVGGVSELLNGQNGIAIKNNPETMANEILKILSYSTEKQHQISQAATDTYNALFTVDMMAEGYEKIYTVLNSHM